MYYDSAIITLCKAGWKSEYIQDFWYLTSPKGNGFSFVRESGGLVTCNLAETSGLGSGGHTIAGTRKDWSSKAPKGTSWWDMCSPSWRSITPELVNWLIVEEAVERKKVVYGEFRLIKV